MPQNSALADAVFTAFSLPFILICLYITQLVYARLQNTTSSSWFLKCTTLTWIVISLSTIVATLQPFLIPCHRTEKKTIITFDKCLNWGLEIVAIILVNLGIGLFSVGSLSLSSMILQHSVTLFRINKKAILAFQCIVLSFLALYTYIYIDVVMTVSTHPELKAKYELSFWLFAGSYGLAMLTCVASAALSLIYIYTLKKELLTLNSHSSHPKFNSATKSAMSIYIQRIWIYVCMFVGVILIYLIAIAFRFIFPWTALYVVAQVTAFGSMTGFQVNMLDLLSKGGDSHAGSHLVSVRRSTIDAK
ncbi:hypothetical protein BKA69DRAFT_1124035 [Paraphysoderma sedebokerense]|nr:hypothetical protein BKA69DRAFT_1124035 [Paraphysoderma sedebokerense]